MANINMNLDLICNLRKRQQLFAMPSFRANPISPYPEYTQEQLDMRRKAEILQYAGNRMNTKTNSLTQTGRYAQVISGKYQPRPYTTVYTETVSYVRDPIRDLSQVIITRTPVYSNPDPNCPLDNMIPVPTSSSDVPGPIINLYNDTSLPLYNYAGSADRSYGITDVIETDRFKTKYTDENTYAFYTITSTSIGANIIQTEPTDITISTLYITNIIDAPQYVYELYVPIGIHFEGKYKTTNTVAATFNTISLSIPQSGFNPQVVFVTNPVSTNRQISFRNNQTFDMSFNVTNKSADFSGTIYIGMLKITNIDLYTEVGYIYDINILTDITLAANSAAEKDNFISRYEFKYGLYYNISDASKNTINCTIAQNASTEPLRSIQLLESSSPT